VNADRKARNLAPLTPEEWINRPSNSKGTTINNVGENRKVFADKADEKAADRFDGYITEGVKANSMISDMQQLVDLGRQFRNGATADWTLKIGPYAAAVGIDVDGLGPIQAYNAITSRIAPQMRQAGSGSNSDSDVKMFFASLPNLQNSVDGNQIIADTMTAVAQNKVAAAEIANRVVKGEMTWQDGEKEIQKLENPYARFKSYQKDRLKVAGSDKPAPEQKPDIAGASTAPTQEALKPLRTVNTPEDVAKLPPDEEFFMSPVGRKRNPNYKK